jgi:AhpD family alkylhydroperoxidase
MTTIQVFDPALCCSSGVCGADVDQTLVSFAADVDWLQGQGAHVERINLAQQPQVFAQQTAIRQLLETEGDPGLPAIVVNGEIKHSGSYPTRAQLAQYAGLPSEPSIFTDQVAELIAIGAAIASNCEPCFKFHYDQARKLGVGEADMRRAVELAQRVKDAPARAVLDLAHRYLDKTNSSEPASRASASQPQVKGGCCGPATSQAPAELSKCC